MPCDSFGLTSQLTPDCSVPSASPWGCNSNDKQKALYVNEARGSHSVPSSLFHRRSTIHGGLASYDSAGCRVSCSRSRRTLETRESFSSLTPSSASLRELPPLARCLARPCNRGKS